MPSKKKNRKSKPKKSTKPTAKRATKARGAKPAARPSRSKRVAKKKQAKKKTERKQGTGARATQRFESAQRRPDEISARRSEDFQGLSRTEQADSESVDELVEEGNVFEAGAVAGVEEADSRDQKEVHTHEVPEDDVPDEYLDQD